MSTKPTLYVSEFGVAHEPMLRFRPATRDEIIAAMPRCGTCDEWDNATQRVVASDGRTGIVCPILNAKVGKTFGCTEHKEHKEHQS